MYKLTNQNSVTRLADGASVPLAPGNMDYAEYLRWLAQGNTPQPVDPVNPSTTALAEIVKLEREQLLPRISREFMLGVMESQFLPAQLALNFAYVSLKAFDDQIVALRAQL